MFVLNNLITYWSGTLAFRSQLSNIGTTEMGTTRGHIIFISRTGVYLTVSIRIFLNTIWKRKIDAGFSLFCHTRPNYSWMMRRESLTHDDKTVLSLLQVLQDKRSLVSVSVYLVTRHVINLVSGRYTFLDLLKMP